MTTHACTDEPCAICAAEEAEELEAERLREEREARLKAAMLRFYEEQRRPKRGRGRRGR